MLFGQADPELQAERPGANWFFILGQDQYGRFDTWRDWPELLQRLTLAVGGAAMRWHIGPGPVAAQVADWRSHAARGIWPLPHPSWRNTGWLRRNPWFEAELVPELRAAVARVLGAG